MFTVIVIVIKVSLLMTEKISHTVLGKNSKILKILMSSFRKCYELLDSELSFARCQPSKIQGYGILMLTQQFLIFLSLTFYE